MYVCIYTHIYTHTHIQIKEQKFGPSPQIEKYCSKHFHEARKDYSYLIKMKAKVRTVDNIL